MARTVNIVPGVYAYVGELPLGCRLCIKGVKMVIFITGLCREHCFYCPVSPQRLYRDKVYVDEEPAHRFQDFIEEAYYVGADGASITGGDPLVVLKRTVRTIRLLKETFGNDFHIHLYTSGRYATRDALLELEEAGLDEIRFHPVEEWMLSRIELALNTLRRVRVGVEMPVIPGHGVQLRKLIERLDQMGVEFVNLNELEVSERNIKALLARGYKVRQDRAAVEGSEELGLEIVRWAAEAGLRITVHYCPASYKDKVQMRARLTRKSLRLRKPYESVTPEGLLARLEADVEHIDKRILDYVEIVRNRAFLPPTMRLRGGVLSIRYPSLRRGARLPVNVKRIT